MKIKLRIIIASVINISTFFLMMGHFAAAAENPDRDQIINDTLNCIESSSSSSSVNWNEVCETYPPLKDVGWERDSWMDFQESRARENTQVRIHNTNELQMSGEYFYAKYEEPDVMEQDGSMVGFGGNYTYRPEPGNFLYTPIANMFRAEGMFASGDFDYEAKGSQTGLRLNKDDYMYELRGLIGREYSFDKAKTIALYTGFGYRYLNDDDDGKLVTVGSTSYYGYEREANYYYLPLGLEFNQLLNDEWTVGAKLEYDVFLQGEQISHLTDGNVFLAPGSQNEDATNEQKHGFGLRASFQVIKEMNHFGLLVEPFVRYWHIDDSEIERIIVQGSPSSVLEPDNRTVELGMKLGLKF